MKRTLAAIAVLLMLAGCGTIDVPTAVKFDYKDIFYPTPTPTPWEF